jgi:hypothetical protein
VTSQLNHRSPVTFQPPYSSRYKAKKKAFTKYVTKYADGKKQIEAELAQMKKHCTTIRVLAHTQVCSERGYIYLGLHMQLCEGGGCCGDVAVSMLGVENAEALHHHPRAGTHTGLFRERIYLLGTTHAIV